MSGYTKLFSSIVTSSIWQEDNATRLVWITMLATADARGVVEASVIGLAHIARVDVDECQRALMKLENPDPFSRTSDFDGRRIEKCDGGWRILNYAYYREKGRSRDRTDYQRGYQKDRRRRQKQGDKAKPKASGPLFDRFWAAYPRKVAKDAARRAFGARKVDESLLESILSALQVQCTSEAWTKDGGKFIPYPATWLNRGQWQDEELQSAGFQGDGVSEREAIDMLFESGQITAEERTNQLDRLDA